LLIGPKTSEKAHAQASGNRAAGLPATMLAATDSGLAARGMILTA
jgi:hypothetical protein